MRGLGGRIIHLLAIGDAGEVCVLLLEVERGGLDLLLVTRDQGPGKRMDRVPALTIIRVGFFSFRGKPTMSWRRLRSLRKSKQTGMVVWRGRDIGYRRE